jgi:tetrapyrrole methylase family protein/MazG family protein
VLQNWEKLKADERKANGEQHVKGLLDGVPLTLPALAQAQEVQDRAKRVGFDWNDIGPVIDKVFEELGEVRSAPTDEERQKELGDLLFAVVNVVRWYKVDAESALRTTNLRWRKRFAYIEKRARDLNRNLNEMTLAEMDVLWEEAKRKE